MGKGMPLYIGQQNGLMVLYLFSPVPSSFVNIIHTGNFVSRFQ